MRRIRWLTVLLLGCTLSTQGQDELDDLIQGSVEDANYLLQGYAAPALKALGFGLNQGWYNSAKTHKLGGFDLTITANAVYYPTSAESYLVDNSQLNNLQLTDPVDGVVPTLLGTDVTNPVYQNVQTGTTVSGPTGLDLEKNLGIRAVPVPMVQAGIGLPMGSELKIRFFPESNAGEKATYKFWGLGLQHDIKQYIRPLKPLPIEVSVLAAYSNYSVTYRVSDTNPDQIGRFSGNTLTIQTLVSAKLSVLTVYGGLGYGASRNKLAMLGSYDFENPPPIPPTSVQDPVKVDTDAGGFLATAGLRFRFGFIALHGQYTFQEYNVLTVGFGINVH